MFDRNFFQSTVGQAALASVAAMCIFVALSTQMQLDTAASASPHPQTVQIALVELA